jgi:hypothetical protein
MKLPFKLTNIEKLGELLVYKHDRVSDSHKRVGVLDNDLEVDNGILWVLDDKGRPLYRVNGINTENGKTRMCGEDLRAKDTHDIVISPNKNIDDFGICISSHIDYYEVTLPRLVKSIKNVGFKGSIVACVVDTSKRPRPLKDLGLNDVDVIQVRNNKYGFSSLLDIDKSHDYWLMLHDTCELTSDFDVSGIDVGLNPDYILLSDGLDIGFYSHPFISRIKSDIELLNPDKIKKFLRKSANVWIPSSGKAKSLPAKYVYGSGKKRNVLLIDIGIKKYVQVQADGARP